MLFNTERPLNCLTDGYKSRLTKVSAARRTRHSGVPQKVIPQPIFGW